MNKPLLALGRPFWAADPNERTNKRPNVRPVPCPQALRDPLQAPAPQALSDPLQAPVPLFPASSHPWGGPLPPRPGPVSP